MADILSQTDLVNPANTIFSPFREYPEAADTVVKIKSR